VRCTGRAEWAAAKAEARELELEDALRPGGNKENDHGEVHREWST